MTASDYIWIAGVVFLAGGFAVLALWIHGAASGAGRAAAAHLRATEKASSEEARRLADAQKLEFNAFKGSLEETLKKAILELQLATTRQADVLQREMESAAKQRQELEAFGLRAMIVAAEHQNASKDALNKLDSLERRLGRSSTASAEQVS